MTTTTLTLKNVPEELYARLTSSAERHRRSIDNEAILWLETVLTPIAVNREERLTRARALRKDLVADFDPQDIDVHKREGRP